MYGNTITRDVNILTRSCRVPGIIYIGGLIVSVFCLSSTSCYGRPEEGEIVIRAEDIDTACGIPDSVPAEQVNDDSLLAAMEQNGIPAMDTLAGTGLLPDTAAFFLSDSIPCDITAESEIDTIPLECPWNRIAFEINGSIYASLRGKAEESDILGAHIVRCMWWNTDPWRGMNAGDSLIVLTGVTGRENQIVALRYIPKEGTANNPFSLYSFHMTGDNYPSHYYSDGTEVMRLLGYMPITTFEEMTGPYGEPRGNHNHEGVDYKAPSGTPIRTCRGGTVSRVNWNHVYNGNCIEISIGGGYSEVFLHLQAIAEGIVAGTVLQKGDTVGFVGNTGRTSTSAHLHYQINDENENSIDPYLFYSSYRRSLPQSDMDEFILFRDRCDGQLSGGAE